MQSISHCGDTYKVATTDGKTRDFWERNLRFKTDVGDDDPAEGRASVGRNDGRPRRRDEDEALHRARYGVEGPKPISWPSAPFGA